MWGRFRGPPLRIAIPEWVVSPKPLFLEMNELDSA